MIQPKASETEREISKEGAPRETLPPPVTSVRGNPVHPLVLGEKSTTHITLLPRKGHVCWRCYDESFTIRMNFSGSTGANSTKSSPISYHYPRWRHTVETIHVGHGCPSKQGDCDGRKGDDTRFMYGRTPPSTRLAPIPQYQPQGSESFASTNVGGHNYRRCWPPRALGGLHLRVCAPAWTTSWRMRKPPPRAEHVLVIKENWYLLARYTPAPAQDQTSLRNSWIQKRISRLATGRS